MVKKKLLILGMCLLSLVIFGEVVLAEENGISIETTEIKESVKNYAKENIANYLTGYLSFENKDINSKKYDLLEPFQMVSESNEQKTSIFPVTENGIVKYVFFVNEIENGKYSTKVSKFLANEIENLRNSYNDNYSISFIEKNGDIYIKHDDVIAKIYTSPMRPINEEIVTQDSLKREVNSTSTTSVDLDKISDIKQSKNPNTRSIEIDQTGTKINWKVSETQGSNQWCSAYAAAMILNNKNDARPTTALQIANFSKKNKDQALTYQDIIKYANTRGVFPYFVNRPMNWQEVLTQVRKSNAIWGAWEGFGGVYQGKWHALDIIGTYKVPAWGGGENRAYFVWNPWFDYPEICNSDNNTYYVVGSKFVWRYSVTNW